LSATQKSISQNVSCVSPNSVKLGKENAAFFSWVFVKDNILVQINGNLPEEQAKKYEAALNALK
jgi:hypothetical protein